MSDFLKALEAEIARREAELEEIRAVRARLFPPSATKLLALPAPQKSNKTKAKAKIAPKASRRRPVVATEPGSMEINGNSIDLTAHQLTLYRFLDQMPAGECISQETLVEAVGSKPAFFAALRELRDKLETCKATIANVRGEGYRLENL